MIRSQPVLTVALAACLLFAFPGPAPAADSHTIDQAHMTQPQELLRALQGKGEKPVILMVGFRVMYAQSHIPGAEYIGPGSEPRGLAALRERAKTLPRKRPIVLYCGCCPWVHCPNVDGTFRMLHDLGFTNVKVLYLPINFGEDWVRKGYPIEKG